VGDTAPKTYLDLEADVTPATFRPASRRLGWWLVGRWFALVDILLVLVVVLLWSEEGFTTLVGIGGGVALGGLVLLVLMLFATPRSSSYRALSQGHIHLVASDDGYHVEGPFGTQTFRWAMYKKAYIDQRFIYLLLTNRVAQVIPLHLVADPDPLLKHLRELGLLRPTPRTFILF
jgi:hypothetical protein